MYFKNHQFSLKAFVYFWKHLMICIIWTFTNIKIKCSRRLSYIILFACNKLYIISMNLYISHLVYIFISPGWTCLCYWTRNPFVLKRQGYKDEAEVKDKHGEPEKLGHLPPRDENTDKNCYQHGKQKNYGAAQPLAAHRDRLHEHYRVKQPG